MSRVLPSSFAAALGLAALLCGAPASAQDQDQDEPVRPPVTTRHGDLVSIFGGDIHVPADVRVLGSVVCVGGDVVLDGRVTEDVVVILGSLKQSGVADGAVSGVLADLDLREARVGREVVAIVSSLALEDSRVGGEVVSVLGSLDRDTRSRIAGELINIGFGSRFGDLWTLFTWMRVLHKLFIFVLLLLIVAIAPQRVRRIGEEAPLRYVAALFVGVLGYLGMLVVVGLLSITIVGIPLAILAFYVTKWLGIAGILFAVGSRIARSLGRQMSTLGAVLLAFGLYVLILLAPTPLGLPGLAVSLVLNILVFLLLELPAVGLVLLTLAGGRPAPPATSGPPPAPAEFMPHEQARPLDRADDNPAGSR